MKQHKSLEDQLFYIGLAFLALGSIIIWVYFQAISSEIKPPSCIWDRLFGIYCPGCGGTRAMSALFQGRLLLSLWYHPLVPYTAVIFGSFMGSQGFARLTGYRYIKGLRFHNWYLYVAIIIIIVNFIAKNLLRLLWHITM